MKFKELPFWIRGALIGLFTGIFFSFLHFILGIVSSSDWDLFSLFQIIGFAPIIFLFPIYDWLNKIDHQLYREFSHYVTENLYLINIVIGFLVGLIIGFLIYLSVKIESKREKVGETRIWNGFAIGGFCLSIFSLLASPFRYYIILSLILSHIGLIQTINNKSKGILFAILGCIFSIIGTIIILLEII